MPNHAYPWKDGRISTAADSPYPLGTMDAVDWWCGRISGLLNADWYTFQEGVALLVLVDRERVPNTYASDYRRPEDLERLAKRLKWFFSWFALVEQRKKESEGGRP